MVPTIGKTDKKKAKKKKKKTDSKKPSAADKPSSKKHEAQKEKRKMRQRAADRQEAVADAAVEGALFGKTARVVGDTAPGSLRGLEVVCRKQTDSHVLVECQDRQEWVEQADISLDVGVRVFPLQLDYDSFPAVAAREEAAALGDLPADRQSAAGRHQRDVVQTVSWQPARQLVPAAPGGSEAASAAGSRRPESRDSKPSARQRESQFAHCSGAKSATQTLELTRSREASRQPDSQQSQILRHLARASQLQGSQWRFKGSVASSQARAATFASASQQAQAVRRI